MFFTITKPSTVILALPGQCVRVNVFFNGQLYFFREIQGKHSEIKFNLVHPGKYEVNKGEVKQILPIQITPLDFTMPEPDRNRMKEYKIIHNPTLQGTPARNFTKTGLIETGVNFWKFPFPVRLFILLHEIGHFYYSDETNCDLFAAKTFVKMGYNNSTAYYSLSKVLHPSEKNNERLKQLFKHLNKN